MAVGVGMGQGVLPSKPYKLAAAQDLALSPFTAFWNGLTLRTPDKPFH